MTDFHANFVNIIIESEKGGVRKSTLTLFLATIAVMLPLRSNPD
jgi:MinD-like ATPase involved in chromosome partitioning or flagellar assembly